MTARPGPPGRETISKSSGEKREYTRGYNRGRNRAISWAEAIIRIAKGYRARLADIDAKRQCASCARWTRGCSTCVWGVCSAGFERSLEPAMWVHGNDHAKVVTTEDFGCVCWLPTEKGRGDA